MNNIYPQYKYKCPRCNGEFVEPSEKSYGDIERKKYYKCCPFCKNEMTGL